LSIYEHSFLSNKYGIAHWAIQYQKHTVAT